MRIWILTPFEPIPTEGDVRLMRAGQLAEELASRGHDVTWWTPDFEHYSKRHRTGGDATHEVAPNYRIRLLASLGYTRHVCVRRLRHNRRLAARWSRAVEQEPTPPELVFSAWPTPDLCDAARAYAAARGIPFVVDVRDLWPDLWLGVAPRALRPAARALLRPYMRMAERVFGEATAVTGITEEYVVWGQTRGKRAPQALDRPVALGFRPPQLDAAERAAARERLAAHGYTREDALTVVFAGTFGRSFDFETVCAAAGRLAEQMPGRVRFVLCGSGEGESGVRALAADTKGVLVLPRLDQSELMIVYEDAHLGLAPYVDIENFQRNVPNKIHEYLAVGLPIVSPVSGRIRALLETERVGLSYTPDDVAGLAACLGELVDDPSMLEALRTRVTAYVAAHDEDRSPAAPLADHLEQVRASAD